MIFDDELIFITLLQSSTSEICSNAEVVLASLQCRLLESQDDRLTQKQSSLNLVAVSAEL